MFVYGVDPRCVEQAPGGRENAKMVSKGIFECFATPADDGNYFLRPDKIKAAFILDGTSGLPSEREKAIRGLEAERVNDAHVQQLLKKVEESMMENSRSTLAQRQRLAYFDKGLVNVTNDKLRKKLPKVHQ